MEQAPWVMALRQAGEWDLVRTWTFGTAQALDRAVVAALPADAVSGGAYGWEARRPAQGEGHG